MYTHAVKIIYIYILVEAFIIFMKLYMYPAATLLVVWCSWCWTWTRRTAASSWRILNSPPAQETCTGSLQHMQTSPASETVLDEYFLAEVTISSLTLQAGGSEWPPSWACQWHRPARASAREPASQWLHLPPSSLLWLLCLQRCQGISVCITLLCTNVNC